MPSGNDPRPLAEICRRSKRSPQSVQIDFRNLLLPLLAAITLSGCSTAPLMPYTTETEALVSYPEIRERIAAVVSVADAVGGSPLANDAEQSQLALLQHWPGAQCLPATGEPSRACVPKYAGPGWHNIGRPQELRITRW
jgi:hypothetical protein